MPETINYFEKKKKMHMMMICIVPLFICASRMVNAYPVMKGWLREDEMVLRPTAMLLLTALALRV